MVIKLIRNFDVKGENGFIKNKRSNSDSFFTV